MAKLVSASSQQEKQRRARKPFIVTKTLDPDRKPTPEELAAVQDIAGMPDESIRTDFIPELPHEAWQCIKTRGEHDYERARTGGVMRRG